MAQKKKNRSKNGLVEKVVLATAILNLVKALIEFIQELTG